MSELQRGLEDNGREVQLLRCVNELMSANTNENACRVCYGKKGISFLKTVNEEIREVLDTQQVKNKYAIIVVAKNKLIRLIDAEEEDPKEAVAITNRWLDGEDKTTCMICEETIGDENSFSCGNCFEKYCITCFARVVRGKFRLGEEPAFHCPKCRFIMEQKQIVPELPFSFVPASTYPNASSAILRSIRTLKPLPERASFQLLVVHPDIQIYYFCEVRAFGDKYRLWIDTPNFDKVQKMLRLPKTYIGVGDFPIKCSCGEECKYSAHEVIDLQNGHGYRVESGGIVKEIFKGFPIIVTLYHRM